MAIILEAHSAFACYRPVLSLMYSGTKFARERTPTTSPPEPEPPRTIRCLRKRKNIEVLAFHRCISDERPNKQRKETRTSCSGRKRIPQPHRGEKFVCLRYRAEFTGKGEQQVSSNSLQSLFVQLHARQQETYVTTSAPRFITAPILTQWFLYSGFSHETNMFPSSFFSTVANSVGSGE